MKFDLGFGNSVCVREAFLQKSYSGPTIIDDAKLMKFDYPTHEGDVELVNTTRGVIERQTGVRYPYIVLTNGATGGVANSLRLFSDYSEFVITRAPYYGRYPGIIAAARLKHATQKDHVIGPVIKLLDYPSNPEGLITDIKTRSICDKVILDGVYYNRVYMPPAMHAISSPMADVVVGSYSKLTGVNGLRVGWIATHDVFLYERLKDLVTAEYCGLDNATTEILKQRLRTLDWAAFEASARVKLDYNREEWSRLEKFFNYEMVKGIGMFYYAPMDKSCKKLLEKAGIHYTLGSTMGSTDDFGRFNLGASNRLIIDAVNAILKADKI